ncbi:MAG TPA: GxxExxY protein [Ktedonobacterales bacterium]
MPERDELIRVTNVIIGAAIEVQSALGPGLLEAVYENCLAHELRERGYAVEQQKPLPLVYKEVQMECGYRLDLLVNEAVIVEVKAVEELAPVHRVQLLSYLRLAHLRVGLLINFHAMPLHHGIKRLVNNL